MSITGIVRLSLCLVFVVILCVSCSGSDTEGIRSLESESYVDWTVTGGDKANTKYSSLDQINKENVHNLEVVWEYRTGDNTDRSTIQANPIVVNLSLIHI